jgi:integrase/recombinase XerD
MKKKIILRRVYHRGKWRILISFGYDEILSALVRQVNGSRYSNTHKSWYTDDNEASLKEILLVFREKAEIDISAITKDNEPEGFTVPEGIPRIQTSGRNKEIPVRRPEQKAKVEREFLLPWSVLTGDSLSDYFTSLGVEVRTIKSSPSLDLKNARKEKGEEIRSRALEGKAIEGLDLTRRYLDEVRYSERTNESYLALLELFFKYFHEKDPVTISMDEVSEFIHDFIIVNGYSKSYQNQMISAIKIFYRISGRSHIDLQLFERPRKSRALPKVFSKEEVQRILNATRNTKHKVLLWMIYSCGLRRSEVTNIKLNDLDHDRGVLHVKEGKGRIDRIVPVSKKVWEKIDEYLDGFHPVKYLFEGQSGARYSSESVYRVFKQALERAGIKKEVGVHSLRHSYATHLHESGLDIRYIQELLGHRSSRTTEIYTHVSRRNLVVIRSPIEDMDVK